LGRLEVGWEKVACWSTKAAISLKRVKIDEKLLRKAYRNSPTLFRMVPSRPSTASPLPRLGSAPHPKFQSLLSQERVKLQTSNLASTFRGSIRTKSQLKILEKRSVGISRNWPNFSGTPYYLRNGKNYGFQIWPVHSEGPSEQKPIKNFGEKGALAYPLSRDCPNFWVPPIISGMGKATDFKFGPYIRRVHPNRSALKILEKREHRRIQGLPIFGYPLLSQERVKLRTSNFACTFIGSV